MSAAPVAPMEARCAVCGDTGSRSQWAGGDMDCIACDVANERLVLAGYLRGLGMGMTASERAWAIYQFAQRQAAPVEQPAQQAEAVEGTNWPVTRANLKRIQEMNAVPQLEAQQAPNELRRAVREMVRLLEAKEWPAAIISEDQDAQALEVEIACLVSGLAAQQAGDVARNALKVARAALHTAEYAIKGREHTGFITNGVAAIDAAIAQGRKA